jgi:hypothetical protein
VLHPSRPGAAPICPRHCDALDLISKTTQGHNGTMTQSYRHHMATTTSTEPSSSPSLPSTRSSLRTCRRRSRRRQTLVLILSFDHTSLCRLSSTFAHAPILALSMLSSCYLIIYQHHCLCRAFMPVYLPIDLSISCNGFGMCATPCCVVVLLDLAFWCVVVCWLVSWFMCCSLASVDCFFELVGGSYLDWLFRSWVRPAVAVTLTVTCPPCLLVDPVGL